MQTHDTQNPLQVLTCAEVDHDQLQALLSRYQMQLVWITDRQTIPGSFWGDAEAGLVGNQLLIRGDTPYHSALHEACHFICMDDARRSALHTNAEGDYDEENAVCYLQILLSSQVSPGNPAQMMRDMDIWGYSFRLGSAQRWFEEDADDAQRWLLRTHLIDENSQPTFRLRMNSP